MPPFAPSQRVPLPDALAGLCFVLLLLLGLLSNGQAWFAAGFSLPFTGWQDFMAGKPMQQAALAMAKAALPAGAAQIERGLSWQLAGDLGPRVREGERDWLFLVDELTPHADGARDAAARAQEVIWLNQRLARQGIALLVAVIPDKSRVAAEHLGSLQRPAIFANRVKDWTARLAQAGVEVIDLNDTLAGLQARRQSPFLRTDSHWSEAGAEAAAARISGQIQRLNSAEQSSPGWQMTGRERLPRPGDLVKLAGIEWLPPALQPRPESVQQSRFEPIATVTPNLLRINAGNADNDDLFGDAELPAIAVIGSSFSRNSNFVPFLAQHLQTRVANFAVDGGDFAGAARAYLGSAAFKQTPPRLLLWEIPERVLMADRRLDRLDRTD